MKDNIQHDTETNISGAVSASTSSGMLPVINYPDRSTHTLKVHLSSNF